ncbi:MAG: 50S ribosomal protein L3 [Actinomycetota bacterium]|nr:50S ribosomal protein L3 [Actinomycetota bacterium]MDA8396514.1 50S ribosomal protein L3 [Actinomycetota bacterium]
MATKALIGRKLGMTQVWDDQNRVIPVTVVKVDPIRVMRVKQPSTDGYSALFVTYGNKDPKRVNKPESGVFRAAGVDPGVEVLEFRLDDVSGFSAGSQYGVEILAPGDFVDVTGTSKGHGFTGGMKRHNFRGQGAAHGNHKKHRAPGSIGACATPARVFKGTRMAGQYGSDKVTTLNLQVVKADAERGLLLIKGAVPGAKGSRVIVRDAVKGGK